MRSESSLRVAMRGERYLNVAGTTVERGRDCVCRPFQWERGGHETIQLRCPPDQVENFRKHTHPAGAIAEAAADREPSRPDGRKIRSRGEGPQHENFPVGAT